MSEVKIKRLSYRNAGATLADVGQAIAEALGAMYNTELNVIYKGEDDTTGFLLEIANAGVKLYSCLSGTKNSNSTTNYASDKTDFIMYYVKTDNVAAFAFGGDYYNKLQIGWAKGTDQTNGTEKWIYFYKGSTSTAMYLFAEAGSVNRTTTISNYDAPNGVSIAPVVYELDQGVIVSDYLYFAVYIKGTSENVAFELEGHEYLCLSLGNNIGTSKLVIKLT